jgi:hypothetical protein
MMQTVEEIITSFDQLPGKEQKEITRIILLRNLETETPSISDQELLYSAEEIFLELDKREAIDAES